MGRRRQARESALQMLYQIDLTGAQPADVFEPYWRGREVEADVREFAERLVLGTSRRRGELDERIGEAAQRWRTERMAVVDRNVLRLALYELIAERETPAAVIIDEAVGVAKRFGSAESGRFVNGILDTLRRGLEGRPAGPAEAEGGP